MGWMTGRLREFGVGLAAHYLRLLALAPVVGATVVAFSMAGALTQMEWLTAPVFQWLIAEPQQNYKGDSLTEFGLPIVWQYAGVLFWAPIALGVAEQVTGKRLRRADLHFKWWLYGLGGAFTAFLIFTLFFMDIRGSRVGGSVVAVVLYAFLFASAMAGVGGLLLIAFGEDQILTKFAGDGEASGQDEAPEGV